MRTPAEQAAFEDGLKEALAVIEKVRTRATGHSMEVPTLAACVEAVTERLAVEELTEEAMMAITVKNLQPGYRGAER